MLTKEQKARKDTKNYRVINEYESDIVVAIFVIWARNEHKIAWVIDILITK
jgi:hypothetical protein